MPVDFHKGGLRNGCLMDIVDKVLRKADATSVESQVTSFLQDSEFLTTAEKDILSDCSDPQERMDIAILLLKSVINLDLNRFCRFLKTSSLTKAREMGKNLIKEIQRAASNKEPVLIDYPEASKICLKNQENIIIIDSVPGIKLVIPSDSLTEDEKIKVSVHYHDPPYADGTRKFIMLTPIVNLEPDGLTFEGPAKPILILPILQEAVSALENQGIDFEHCEKSLLHRNNINSSWKKEDCTFFINVEDEYKCIRYTLNHFSLNSVICKNVTTKSNNNSSKCEDDQSDTMEDDNESSEYEDANADSIAPEQSDRSMASNQCYEQDHGTKFDENGCLKFCLQNESLNLNNNAICKDNRRYTKTERKSEMHHTTRPEQLQSQKNIESSGSTGTKKKIKEEENLLQLDNNSYVETSLIDASNNKESEKNNKADPGFVRRSEASSSTQSNFEKNTKAGDIKTQRPTIIQKRVEMLAYALPVQPDKLHINLVIKSCNSKAEYELSEKMVELDLTIDGNAKPLLKNGKYILRYLSSSDDAKYQKIGGLEITINWNDSDRNDNYYNYGNRIIYPKLPNTSKDKGRVEICKFEMNRETSGNESNVIISGYIDGYIEELHRKAFTSKSCSKGTNNPVSLYEAESYSHSLTLPLLQNKWDNRRNKSLYD
ncbi:uncharacterized protein TRIADDRAFT_62478 [Trichoplax adhaerens]|uniref:ZU5 domain-containing protein n=1 Tax=Trichoplax adhaerens TaxID=10228 RepID=B3SDX4_TRIAD|nr:predicted protein [Trichoplax adhaerens]EDV19072.1 predicted protein [Trichoplax adhaerens]|eukprot:XP_002118443.1 predicted protein [Trichoplax adhaerens]